MAVRLFCKYSRPLMNWKRETEGDEKTGIDIVRRAIEAPVRQIANNAGLEGAVIVEAVKKAKKELASMPRRKNMSI